MLSPEKLSELNAIQDRILDAAADLVSEKGLLAYATCSVLQEENEMRVEAFLRRNPDWQQIFDRHFPVDGHGDGFFTSHLMRVSLYE